MPLDALQQATLKTSIANNTATVIYAGSPTPINQVPNNDDGNIAIRDWYNSVASPDFYVWRDLPVETVLNSIVWANMTPTDAPDGTQTWLNRSMACQGKQFNLQNMIVGRTTVPMKRTNFRAGIQDSLTNLPSGVGGAALAAGWTAVRDAAKRLATNAEKLFATGTGSFSTPADAVVDGNITATEVSNARNLP